MPITLADVRGILDRAGMNYETRSESLLLFGGSTDVYKNEFGVNSLALAVSLAEATEEGFEYMRVYAPFIYKLTAEQKTSAFFEYCVRLAYEQKCLKFGYDPRDGEVSLAVEFYVEDATMTDKQVRRAVSVLAQVADETYPHIQNALKHNILPTGPDPRSGLLEAVNATLSTRSAEELERLLEGLKDEGGGSDDGGTPPPPQRH